ncbi:MAG: heme lyase NrfEFG subunit NrfE, partial [Hyphomicrobiales bacterium]
RHSHSAKPLLYKISGVWGNHEGSMMLWVMLVAFFGALVALFSPNLPPALRARVLSVQASIGVAFLLFIIATSNPFLRLAPAPADGQGLNPLLQDPALAIHPPFLYGGYVGFSMAFSFAIAALIEGRVDAAWARWVRPWTLAAWMLLTIGIALGSWWAYYELGWGGWWFWDPVENASLLPWLSGTALLHSAIVVEKRGALRVWTILLAILTFGLSLMGTFLVRSGVLTSVHAFAVDPARGVFILLILCVFVGGALTLYAWRAPVLKSGGIFAPISREGAIVFNNLLLVTACATVFVGTLYPLVLEAVNGEKISVGAPFFNATFVPLFIPLLLALPIGPFLAWKRGDLMAALQRLFVAFGAALAIAVVVLVQRGQASLLAALAIGLSMWLIVGALSELAFRIKLFRAPITESLRRAVNLPRSSWGMMIAHAGMGVMVLGIAAISAWKVENIIVMKPGGSHEIGGVSVVFNGATARPGPNYDEDVGHFTIREKSGKTFQMEASKRVYLKPPMPTTETGIHPYWTGDLYLALGDRHKDGSGTYTVRLYFNPLAPLIWLGALIMFIGGGVSLTDRRYRFGVPKKARAKQPAAA